MMLFVCEECKRVVEREGDIKHDYISIGLSDIHVVDKAGKDTKIDFGGHFCSVECLKHRINYLISLRK